MARFRFRLQTLLKVRLAQRDERREALARAHQAEAIIEDRIEATNEEIQEARAAQRKGAKPGPVNVDSQLNLGRHELTLRSDLERLGKQKQQVIQERERRQAALVEADRGVKVLEKLKERQQQEFNQQQMRRETIAMDEVAERLHQNRNRVKS